MKDDVIISALEKDSDDFVQVSDEEKEDNEEKDEEEEEVEGPETPAESISVEVIIADEEGIIILHSDPLVHHHACTQPLHSDGFHEFLLCFKIYPT